MKTEPNKSAFPEIDSRVELSYEHPFAQPYSTGGLTKREYFAALAMQGITSNEAEYVNGMTAEHIAMDAVKIADFLVIELNKPPFKYEDSK